MAELRIGLIGLGVVGKIHAEAYRELTGGRLVAVADSDSHALSALDASRGIVTYADARRMLEEARLDIVCIATPAASHEALTELAAAKKIQVLVEKPIALTPESAHRMIAVCAEAGVRLFYGSTYRFLPAVRRARELLQAGAIGEIALMREHALGGKGTAAIRPMPPSHYPVGGPGGFPMGLVDHGIHLIDVFAWLSGAKVVGGHGRGNRSGQPMRTEHLHLDYDNGAAAELIYNECTFPTELPNEGLFSLGDGWDVDGYVKAGGWIRHPSSIHFYGTTGALRIFHYANLLYQFGPDGVRQIPLQGKAAPDHFRAQMQCLIEDVRADRPATTPGEVGLATLETLLIAYR
ncbi:MAG: Gfo/Idh/MocA family protein [Hyphomicrobium sp.]|uniref:Gfo/Idh/MocA family protein n=1 Tax=Hyphomicrobium sp. TaxID=82 RepID=UPI003D14A5BD